MIRSMSAFARAEVSQNHIQASWELRTVNHRHCDVHLRLPDDIRRLEPECRALIARYIKRGRLDGSLSVNFESQNQQSSSIDVLQLQQVAALSDQILSEVPGTLPLTAKDYLQWPGVVGRQTFDEETLEYCVLEALDVALTDLVEGREREGLRLQQVMVAKFERIEALVVQLQDDYSVYEQALKARFTAKAEELLIDDIDTARLHQEIALLVTKADIAEELDRLLSHLEESHLLWRSKKPVGRRLDILLQEFNREANTLGSKACHVELSRAAVELKVLIDQVREQSLNLE